MHSPWAAFSSGCQLHTNAETDSGNRVVGTGARHIVTTSVTRHARPAVAWLTAGGSGALLAVGMLNLVVAFAIKAPCLGPWPGRTVPGHCYTDIMFLYQVRDLSAHVFPYVHGNYFLGASGNVFMGHGEIEYPVLTGLLAWLTALPGGGHAPYFVVNAAVLVACGAITVLLLWRLAGRRAWLFALSPVLTTFALVNWDLVSVATTVAALYCRQRGRTYYAAALLALGACFKLWPGFLLVPLVLEELSAGRRRRALTAGVLAASIAAAVNGPFIIANWRGWYAPFAYQAGIGLSTGTSVWDWVTRTLPVDAVDTLAWAIVALGFGAIAAWSFGVARKCGAFPFVESAFLMVSWYLVAAKDSSPQYVLWLLPLFVLLRLPVRLWWAQGALTTVQALMFLWWDIGAYTVACFVVTCLQVAALLLMMHTVLGQQRVEHPVVGRGERRWGGWSEASA